MRIRIKKAGLGTWILLALILGLITGESTRLIIHNTTTLDSISSNLGYLSEVFLHLIKMIISPLVFSTLVVGITKLGDAHQLGKMFIKTIFIFLIGGAIALLVGFAVVDILEPGKAIGHHLIDTALGDASAGIRGTTLTTDLGFKSFMEQIIPISITESFAQNKIIQIVVFSIFVGVAGLSLGEKAGRLFEFIGEMNKLIFKITEYVMLFAPLAVFGSVTSTISHSGLIIISSYLLYLAEFLLCCFILWAIMVAIGFLILGKRIFTLLSSLSSLLGIAFSTSSSEAVLPSVIEKLEQFGIDAKVSGFVVPIGYSFNLVASMLNCVFATMFLVQLHGYTLSLNQKATMFLMLMITSKGIAAIPRASLIVVAATLASLGIPESAVLILFPIDGFLDMFRSATNVFANALSAAIVHKWERKPKLYYNRGRKRAFYK
jgi:Na+/H+-dicarboxylate symporter